MALFDAAVDLNPHQIEAALFAIQSPLSKGVILADEVGLGKTIEAGIVLCQFWAERKRRLLVICPASIRKQWALELEEKFHLPVRVLDAKAHRDARRSGRPPLGGNAIVVMSHHYANRIREELRTVEWDLVVLDEAHKLRNAYRPSNKVGRGIRWATEDHRKLLLTATPLQNSLLELFGLSTLIDEHLFGDVNSFRSQYASPGSNLAALRQRLSIFCKRTLRNQVTEYIRYTERRAITQPFTPTDEEHALYEAVSDFLQREDSYALPRRQRHLTALILHKLLASSSPAIAATLDKLRARLETLRDEQADSDPDFAEQLVEAEEIEDDLLDEILAESEDVEQPETAPITIDHQKLREEIGILQQLASRARGIGVDTKTEALLQALEIGLDQMTTTGAARKALVFTESRRTQEYLREYLESHGYKGQVVLFSGTNSGPEATAIYERWIAKNRDTGRSSGSRTLDVRTALIEHFRDEATILLATEAAAEGINLQFCSLVVNYDLPWNPQRIEQRIGRCHRYGQKHDVVVINFLNERNAADRRVLELLTEKFSLFDGVFGASDEVLGSIESSVDFEKRILGIYQECRTPDEIDEAFRALQAEMDEQIRTRLDDTRRVLFEHFDEDVHERLRLQLADAKAQLDRVGKRFWSLTRLMLDGRARFDDAALAFDLEHPPRDEIPRGRYHLISKSRPESRTDTDEDGGGASNVFLYRLSHPLGEHVVDGAKALATPHASIIFDVTNHPTRLHVIEALRGKAGYLTLARLSIDSYEREEYLLFSGFDEIGAPLAQETMAKLFNCAGRIAGPSDTEHTIPATATDRLRDESKRHAEATISRSLEQNNAHFNEARDKLERWADDMVLSAEKALLHTKRQIKARRREARQAVTLDEQRNIQERIRKLERRQQSPASRDLQGRGRGHREARPAHRLPRTPLITADRGGNPLHDSVGSGVACRDNHQRSRRNRDRMNPRYEKLKTLLMELFQLDQPDLDFGLYRVMHAKSAEISQFLDEDLLPQVKDSFALYQSADKAELEKELDKATAQADDLGVDPDDSSKVKELRARLERDAVDIDALESEIYDHLYSFFRRYYSEGDFLAKRVYKPGVYAIPYEGEEVTLHWANKDQYYVKTSEYLRDYAFRLRPTDGKNPMRVHFRLTDATEGEHGNVKAASGKGRVFALASPGESGRDFIAEDDGESGKELVIRFEYRPATLADWPDDQRDKRKTPPGQKDLLALASKCILETVVDAAPSSWIEELAAPHVMASGERADYSRLDAHLHRYTARNTFDYFIHKDLGTFLRRELDFYIKNEVMHLDDLDDVSTAACRAVSLQDSGHPTDRRQSHRFPCSTRRFPENAVVEEEVRGRDDLLYRGCRYPGGVLLRHRP
ncbi:SNF2-related protein [Candidatus Palauibacter sp.]|uniref:SNF2-related protein n=1 Tax=Candidatus Palauibacter sp. TaxID=3101350 RepID=UPI003B012C9F